MDEPKYIENFSTQELEAELVDRKKKAVTRVTKKVYLRSSGNPPIHGTIEIFADQPYPDYVVLDNVVYHSERTTSFDGHHYDNAFVKIVTKIEK
jgi:hypothetical protein